MTATESGTKTVFGFDSCHQVFRGSANFRILGPFYDLFIGPNTNIEIIAVICPNIGNIQKLTNGIVF